VRLHELTGVYATIDRGGVRFRPYYLRKVEDRFGRTLEDHTALDDQFASFDERVAAGYARLFDSAERVMKPETAYLITHLMREVVKEGTGAAAQRLGKPAAGKTGTTNDSFDTWFMGFTRDLVTGVWLGYDRYDHPLGRYETGGRASLPIWVDYMKAALAGRPQPEFSPPPEAKIVFRRINEDSGKLAASGDRRSVEAPFVEGMEPKEAELEAGQVDPREMMWHDAP
jgi:penicillin-binding protein 1A